MPISICSEFMALPCIGSIKLYFVFRVVAFSLVPDALEHNPGDQHGAKAIKAHRLKSTDYSEKGQTAELCRSNLR
jgi:hypothetical protein